MNLGIWFDAPRPKAAHIDRVAERLAAHVDGVSISLNAGTKPLHRVTWEPKALADFTMALQSRGVEVEWMCYPVGAEVQRLIQSLASAYELVPIAPALEFDVETQASLINPEHVEALAEAFPALPWTMNLVLTTDGRPRAYAYPWLKSGRVRVLRLQAYEFFKSEDHWAAAPMFRPDGGYADTNVRQVRLLELTHNVVVELGQAVYGQRHPAPHPQGIAAMRKTRARLLSARRSIRCWSYAAAERDPEVWTYLAETRPMMQLLEVA